MSYEDINKDNVYRHCDTYVLIGSHSKAVEDSNRVLLISSLFSSPNNIVYHISDCSEQSISDHIKTYVQPLVRNNNMYMVYIAPDHISNIVDNSMSICMESIRIKNIDMCFISDVSLRTSSCKEIYSLTNSFNRLDQCTMDNMNLSTYSYVKSVKADTPIPYVMSSPVETVYKYRYPLFIPRLYVNPNTSARSPRSSYRGNTGRSGKSHSSYASTYIVLFMCAILLCACLYIVLFKASKKAR